MPSDHTIRPLTPSDTNALLQFYLSRPSWIAHWFDPFPQPDAEKVGKHLAQAAAGNAVSLGLVTPDGTVAGHGFILALDATRPVFGIGLAEPLIGSGSGRTLMAAVMADADSRQVPKVTLTVFKDNARARRLYESFGFVIAGEHGCRSPGDSHAMERVRGNRKGSATE